MIVSTIWYYLQHFIFYYIIYVMKLILVLHNIRSTYNVGAILRTAEGFGVEKVILSGYTPASKYTRGATALPHILEKTTSQITKTALGAERMVTCEWSTDIIRTLSRLHDEHYLVAGLENNLDTRAVFPLGKWRDDIADRNSLAGVVLVLGEEMNGIDDSLLEMCDLCLEIPMKGKKESFNVSVASGIALYELLGRGE